MPKNKQTPVNASWSSGRCSGVKLEYHESRKPTLEYCKKLAEAERHATTALDIASKVFEVRVNAMKPAKTAKVAPKAAGPAAAPTAKVAPKAAGPAAAPTAKVAPKAAGPAAAPTAKVAPKAATRTPAQNEDDAGITCTLDEALEFAFDRHFMFGNFAEGEDVARLRVAETIKKQTRSLYWSMKIFRTSIIDTYNPKSVCKETEAPGEEGYVMSNKDGSNTSYIHINFHLTSMWETHALAYLIIHEASHRFIRTDDWAYDRDDLGRKGRKLYRELTPDEASKNADSYALAVMCIYRRQRLTRSWMDRKGRTAYTLHEQPTIAAPRGRRGDAVAPLSPA